MVGLPAPLPVLHTDLHRHGQHATPDALPSPCRPLLAYPDRYAVPALAAGCGTALLLAAAVLSALLGVRLVLALACCVLQSLSAG